MPENQNELSARIAKSSAGGMEEEQAAPSPPKDPTEKRTKRTTLPVSVDSENPHAGEVVEDNIGSPPSGSPPDEKDPKEELEILEEAIKGKEGELNITSEELRLKKGDYEVLKKLFNEITQILKNYGDNLKKLQERRENFIFYSNTKTPGVIDAIGVENKNSIDKIVQNLKQEISNKRDYIKITMKADIDKAQKDYDIAKNRLDDAIEFINNQKSLPKDITNKFSILDRLKESIEKEEDMSYNYRYYMMYFYMTKFNNTLVSNEKSPPDFFEILSLDELKSNLDDAWLVIYDVMDNVRNLKIVLETKVKQRSQLEIELKDLEDNLDKNILEKIKAQFSN